MACRLRLYKYARNANRKGQEFFKRVRVRLGAVIINETAAKVLGYTDPIGKKLFSNFQDASGATKPISYDIVGVVKDFHFESLRQNIYPLILRLDKDNGLASFKVNTANIQPLIKQIEAKWKAMAPGMPFSYRFMDEAFDSMYRSEQRVGEVSVTFAILAIFIACLGLFGLVTYMAEQRTKEIGVRKVLGASVSNLVAMLSKDF